MNNGYLRVSSKSALTKVLEEKKKVLLAFEAEWCGPCKMIKPYLLKRCQQVGATLVLANVDKSEELVDLYRVPGIPSMVLLKNDVEGVRLKSLAMSAEQVEHAIRAYINCN